MILLNEVKCDIKPIYKCMKILCVDDVLFLISKNITLEEISKQLQCSVVTLRKFIKKNNIVRERVSGNKLIGKKYGFLTVVKESGRNKWKQKLWLCKCSCGKEHVVHGRELKNGDTTSCGCLTHKTGCSHHKWSGYGDISGTKWYRILHGAKTRNIKVNVTKKYIHNLLYKQNFLCAVSGLSIDNSNMSLDRIDSNKNYEPNNVFWTHKNVNVMRWEFDLIYFKSLCNSIANKSHQTNPSALILKEKNGNWRGCGNIGMKYWGDLIRSSKSKKRGRYINFDADIKYAWEKFVLQSGVCALSNLPINFSNHYKKRGTASFDRIDSTLDYTNDNTWWVHKDVNRMKWIFDLNYFLKLCQLISSYKEKEKQNE